ncbi:MAG: glucose-6-phosphate dehydrogenase [Enterobacteriaceae bacterium PSmelAO3-2]|nr:glucose-6-phosphate dehydrogenase [Enterobacteriaceae bacterium Cmel17]WMC17405.1 MAG: glucose-6-phosphate dehydrogenase [Enterobacteriaceae bacterium Cmel21]WMC17611.1 MAG: glucose-6-phosphate dehydrogenase [Enterobacteriaceae bacterium PSmelAO3-2]WMC17816.1 MAG: glucose-6-phosphate dehydrogenase [Enterobacteriaceae bacterium PSmelAO3-1]WMC18019.1 MAG: glucose-6-phosphate dehydrogenase [Enterobacteriaceae bacterium PSmelAO1]
MEKIKPCDFIIFGVKGDLSKRKILPSLYYLEKTNNIHNNTCVIGVGRSKWHKIDYINMIRKSLVTFLKEKINEKIWLKFISRFKFCNLDVYYSDNFIKLKKILDQKNRVSINYCAMPSSTFSAICDGLGKAKINKKTSRIVIEKPLGTNLESYNYINKKILKYFNESQVYRIDHYLGKETILNLLAFRFSNSFFLNNWGNHIIDSVQITVSEEVGIEGRIEYFDKTGQIKDMIQNHLLQILSIIAMESPKNLNTNSIREKKIKIVRSLRKIDYNNINEKIVLGQYTFGKINGINVPGYLDEINLDKNSNTETFVSLRVDIDNLNWAGVPFYLRSGKRLKKKFSEIVIYFKNLPINLFKEFNKKNFQNKLIIRLQPNEGVEMQILNKLPGLKNKYELQLTKLDFNFYRNNEYKTDAYELLILEIMHGIQSHFVSCEELEESWKWIDPIINGCKITKKKPILYKSGSWGPEESNFLIKKDGREWNKYN